MANGIDDEFQLKANFEQLQMETWNEIMALKFLTQNSGYPNPADVRRA